MQNMPRIFNLSYLFNFNRKIADVLSPFLALTPLTPNHITTLAMACGIGAGTCMSLGSRKGMLFGALLLQTAFILDNCDGAVARIKSMQSEFGRWYDYSADLVVDFAFWAGLTIGAFRTGSGPWVWWVGAAAVAGSVANFVRVIRFRARRKSGTLLGSRLPAFVDALSDDGDPSLLVWLVALFGQPAYLLVLGAAYIHLLWILPVL